MSKATKKSTPQPRNRRTSVRISDIERSVDKVTATPRINPTTNITAYGSLAGGAKN